MAMRDWSVIPTSNDCIPTWIILTRRSVFDVILMVLQGDDGPNKLNMYVYIIYDTSSELHQ